MLAGLQRAHVVAHASTVINESMQVIYQRSGTKRRETRRTSRNLPIQEEIPQRLTSSHVDGGGLGLILVFCLVFLPSTYFVMELRRALRGPAVLFAPSSPLPPVLPGLGDALGLGDAAGSPLSLLVIVVVGAVARDTSARGEIGSDPGCSSVGIR